MAETATLAAAWGLVPAVVAVVATGLLLGLVVAMVDRAVLAGGGAGSGLSPLRLELEVTETGIVHDLGTAKRVQITKRDGYGKWGGRVTTIKIIGSSKTVTTTGSGFQSRFGMRSSLYTVTKP